MFPLRRFPSRLWLLAFFTGAALLFGLAMLHPYPRQSLFGPTIRGKPWCVWESAIRNHAHHTKPLWAELRDWVGLDDIGISQTELLDHAEMLPLILQLAQDQQDEAVRRLAVTSLTTCCQLRDPCALPMLRRCLDDHNRICRINAAYTIWVIDNYEPVLQPLQREADDRHNPY